MLVTSVRCSTLIKPSNNSYSGLRVRENQDANVVRAAIGDRGVKSKDSVAGDRQIVAQIVLNHHAATGTYQGQSYS